MHLQSLPTRWPVAHAQQTCMLLVASCHSVHTSQVSPHDDASYLAAEAPEEICGGGTAPFVACPPSVTTLIPPDASPGARSLSTRAEAVLGSPDGSSANISTGHSLPQNGSGSGAPESAQAAGWLYLVKQITPLRSMQTQTSCLACNSDLPRTVRANELHTLLACTAVTSISCWPT